MIHGEGKKETNEACMGMCVFKIINCVLRLLKHIQTHKCVQKPALLVYL